MRSPQLTNGPLSVRLAAEALILDERCLGPAGVVCPDCQRALDVAQGRWMPRNPDASLGTWLLGQPSDGAVDQ